MLCSFRSVLGLVDHEDMINVSKPLIVAKNLSLLVPEVRQNERTLMRNPLQIINDLYFSRRERSEISLLDNISFKLQPGERIGLIGKNGAGKSTLLRLLAGIYSPSSGNLLVNGVAKGLFDISLGMHLDASGLENIYLRGLHMGLGLKAIHSLIPNIVAFSELKDHIDKPFNTYSTGMRLRLAISVSTMIMPDILLLDEWIGAGDAGFSTKVKKRMLSLIESSRGLILATHNADLMKSLCSHGLILDSGRVVFFGAVDDALKYYKTMHNA